jgi:Domain of unknown function (DUF5060)
MRTRLYSSAQLKMIATLKSYFAFTIGSIFGVSALAAPGAVSFSQSAPSVQAYDFIELTVTLNKPDATNPFTDASVGGSFETADGSKRWQVEGFCDSSDGTVYRLRFMPPTEGDYKFSASYRQGAFQKDYSGIFHVVNAHRKGPIRVDPQYRWHFIFSTVRRRIGLLAGRKNGLSNTVLIVCID